MNTQLPEKIDYILKKYIQFLNAELGEDIYGIYLYGSLAQGTFNEYLSDIDFITVLKSELTEEQLRKVKHVHKRLSEISSYADKMEGEYVTLSEIKTGNLNGTHPYFANSRYQGRVSIKSIQLMQLKQHNIKLCGRDFDEISSDLDWIEVKKELHKRLNDYWALNAQKWLRLLSDGWIAMTVLNICRIYYALENNEPTSKCIGGEFAMHYIPEKWHQLIKEALRIQSGSSAPSLYSSRVERMKDTSRFVKYMVEYCNVRYFDDVNEFGFLRV